MAFFKKSKSGKKQTDTELHHMVMNMNENTMLKDSAQNISLDKSVNKNMMTDNN